jgi:hypothetical protein
MRDFQGLSTTLIPEDLDGITDYLPVLRRDIGHLDYFLRDLSRGIARIQNGQIPDGSGTPIIDIGISDKYWYKPGILDAFTAYMQKQAGGTGIISSTAHPTKGFVYLGSAAGLAFDEVNTRVGLNEGTPLARLHMVVPAPSGLFTRPDPLVGTTAQAPDWGFSSGTNAEAILDDIADDTPGDPGDGEYMRWTGGTGFGHTQNAQFVADAVDPGVDTGFKMHVTARCSAVGRTNFIMVMQWFHFSGGGPTPAVIRNLGGPEHDNIANQDADIFMTGTFVKYTFTLTDAECAGIQFTTSPTRQPWFFAFAFSGGATSGSDFVDIARIAIELPVAGGGSAETLQIWESPSFTNALDFVTDGTGLDLTMSGDSALMVTSGDDTSGVRVLSASSQGRIEVGTNAQTAMTLIMSGNRNATGTQLTQKFTNVTLNGTATINGGSPAAGRVAYATDSNGLIAFAAASTLPWTYVAVTGTYAALTTDAVIDATSGTFTVTLPTAVGVTGKLYDVKNSGTGVITVATTSAQTIDGGTTAVLKRQFESITMISTGTGWDII